MTINGQPFSEGALDTAIVDSVATQVREKLGGIRHPVTGEFPVVLVSGDTLETLSIKLEGSAEFVAMAQRKLGHVDRDESPDAAAPGQADPEIVVFLSYASEDRALAERIALALNDAGVRTWWADWKIRSGESIRQRIDDGIGECTHFLVLLTPTSIKKPWVNLEIDAGLFHHLDGHAQFIPLRSDFLPTELPPLLRGMHSPHLDSEHLDVSQLINDIYGVARRPPLGKAPNLLRTHAATTQTGYSVAATAVAKLFVETTKFARKLDPQMGLQDLAARTGLTEEDAKDALFELGNMVTLHREDLVFAEDALFVEFDRHWKPWNPRDDALRIATELVNDPSCPDTPSEIAARIGWDARRMNPALAYLGMGKLVRGIRAFNGGQWLFVHICRTDETRRFVKSRA